MAECILCNKNLAGLETVTMNKKGLETIKKCSVKRDDGIDLKLDRLEEVVLHVSCRKTYINHNMIKAYLKRKRLESQPSQEQSSDFDYSLKCIFCNEDAEENSNKDPVRTIKKAQTKESIESFVLKRGEGDSVSETIMRRIQNVDLVAVQAKYHRSCYDTFRLSTPSKAEGSRKRGRPECDSTIMAMDEIYTFISHSEKCQFTINDLKGAVSGVCPDDRAIIKKIKETCGDQVIISSSAGKPTLFCFGNAFEKVNIIYT